MNCLRIFPVSIETTLYLFVFSVGIIILLTLHFEETSTPSIQGTFFQISIFDGLKYMQLHYIKELHKSNSFWFWFVCQVGGNGSAHHLHTTLHVLAHMFAVLFEGTEFLHREACQGRGFVLFLFLCQEIFDLLLHLLPCRSICPGGVIDLP